MFSFFFGRCHPVLAKNIAEKRFYNFLIFYYFFRNFLARAEYERNSGLKFCFYFFGLSYPILAKNIAGRGFIVFFLIFLLFFSEFYSCVEYERNSALKFCFHFLGLSDPVLAKNNAAKRFYNFLNFLIFFSEFSCPGRVWTEFWSKILFSLFRPITSHFA